MRARVVPAAVFRFVPPALIAAYASSEVGKYIVSNPESIVADIAVRPSDADPDLHTFTGRSIDVRAGYGAFAFLMTEPVPVPTWLGWSVDWRRAVWHLSTCTAIYYGQQRGPLFPRPFHWR